MTAASQFPPELFLRVGCTMSTPAPALGFNAGRALRVGVGRLLEMVSLRSSCLLPQGRGQPSHLPQQLRQSTLVPASLWRRLW